MILGKGKNLVKGPKRGNARNPVNNPMTGIGIAIIERIGTTKIATRIGKGKKTGAVIVIVIVIEHVIVIETEVRIVVVTMSAIVTEVVIVLEKGRVRET